MCTNTGNEHLTTHSHNVEETPLDVKFVMFRADGMVTRSAVSQLVCGLEYENCIYDVGRNGVSVNRYNKFGSFSWKLYMKLYKGIAWAHQKLLAALESDYKLFGFLNAQLLFI